MKPVLVEIIAYAPTQYYTCQHCEVVWNEAEITSVKKFHDDATQSSVPPDIMREYNAVSDWVIDAVEKYGGRVVFKVIDATSVEGLLKSVRYGVRRYPAVIVGGQDKYVGTDFSEAQTSIDQHLHTLASDRRA